MSRQMRKLPAADREGATLKAAAPIFARSGRVGTTTKEIAKAAGVSQAILHPHFTSKEALYSELETHCVAAAAVGDHLLGTATPSTEILVTGVAMLLQAVFSGIGPQRSHEDTKRLLTAGLLDDWRFAKAFLKRHVEPWIGLLTLSLAAAREGGDADSEAHTGKVELWFAHRLANTMHLLALPDKSVVDYGSSRDELVASAVGFLLRGLGLKEASIRRCHDPSRIDDAAARILWRST